MKIWTAGICALLLAGCAANPATGPVPANDQAAAKVPSVTLPQFSEFTLPNGVQVRLMPKHDVPLIALDARVRGGAIADREGKAGTASLLADLMEKGAGKRDAYAFAQAIDQVGGDLSVGATKEYLDVSADFMARDRDLMLSLVADVLQRPRLPKDEFMKVRERAIQSLVAAKDSNPTPLVPVYGNAWLFGDHPYARPTDGSESSLAQISLADLKHYYANQVGADRLIISVVGDFDPAAFKKALTDAFGSWRKAGAALPTVPAAQPIKGRHVLLVDKPGATQTYFWMGNVGIAHDSDKRVPVGVVNTAFGGSFTSMLNEALRIKSGLTYGARSVLDRPSQPGSLAMFSYTRTAKTGQAMDMALDVLKTLKTQGIPDGKLAPIKTYLQGQFPPSIETNPDLADLLGRLAFYHMDRKVIDNYAEDIQAVTPAEAKDVIASVYPDPDNLAIVMIGDADKIRDVAKKYGPVTEMKISAGHFMPTSK